ncbi:MAG: lytic transglycosylase domain-containing protein [Solirubrobacteraceae bacterium]
MSSSSTAQCMPAAGAEQTPAVTASVRDDAFWFEAPLVPAVQTAAPTAPKHSPRAAAPHPLPPRPAAHPPPPPVAKPREVPRWEITAAALTMPDPPKFAVARLKPPPAPPTATVGASGQPWGWIEGWGFDTGEHAAARARWERRRGGGRGHSRVRRAIAPVALLAVSATVVIGVGGLPISTTAGAAGPAAAASTHPHSSRVAPLGFVVVPAPSTYALQTIPRSYLKLYVRVGNEYGLDWTMLAAVGQIESRSGTSSLPGVSSGTNYAGAAGPAQFEPATWQRFGVDADGGGQMNPYDPVDAITSMAAYLKASGAPQHWNQALVAYNHSQQYADTVTALSGRFTARG